MSQNKLEKSGLNVIRKKFASFLRETVAICSWIFVITKLFIYDIDILVISRFGSIQAIYPYKVFFVLGFVALLWLFLRTWGLIKLFLFVIAYPLILLFWRIPKVVFKRWALVVMLVPGIEGLINTFKWRFILGSGAMLAAIMISLTNDKRMLIGGMAFLFFYLLAHYILRVRMAFRTSIFASIADVVGDMWRHSVNTYKTKEYQARSGEGAKPEDYEKKHLENVKELYLNNLVWAFLAGKLNEALSRRATDVYFIIAVIYSSIATLIVFGFEYLALFRIEPSAFRSAGLVSVWHFLLFSFNVLMHTNFATVQAVGGWAIGMANLEVVAGSIIFFFFVFVLLTSSRERYRQDLKNLAAGLTLSAKEIERFLDRKVHLRLIDVEVKIIASDPQFPETMRSLGRHPQPDQQN